MNPRTHVRFTNTEIKMVEMRREKGRGYPVPKPQGWVMGKGKGPGGWRKAGVMFLYKCKEIIQSPHLHTALFIFLSQPTHPQYRIKMSGSQI